MTGLKTGGTNWLDEGWKQYLSAFHRAAASEEINTSKIKRCCLCLKNQMFRALFFKVAQGQRVTMSESRGADGMLQAAALSHVDQTRWHGLTRQNNVRPKLIASARVFGWHHSCAFSHCRARGSGRCSENADGSLGAIRLRGDQPTGRFCVLTLMECKQRRVLQWWRRSTPNNEENNRGTKNKNHSSQHLEYLQHEPISAWHHSGHSKGPLRIVSKRSADPNGGKSHQNTPCSPANSKYQ